MSNVLTVTIQDNKIVQHTLLQYSCFKIEVGYVCYHCLVPKADDKEQLMTSYRLHYH